jgi:MYXO-CTERM domain-containing protein
MRREILVSIAAGVALLGGAATARANGITAHAHVSDLAVEELPAGALRDLLSDPEVRQALRSGSVFPDSGYAADDPYGELAHWEPFTDAYLRWIVAEHPPPWTELEDRRRVAFLLGAMSHGMSDQVFDSLFMHKTAQYDGSSDDLDVACETFLVIEHDPRISPLSVFLPGAEVQQIFATELGHDTPVETFERGMNTVRMGLVAIPLLADSQYDAYWEALPWSATHYYEGTSEPGSLQHIAMFVARYWQVVWERLHGTDALERSLLGTWPEEGGTNFDVDHTRAEARAMLVFGHAIDSASFSADAVVLRHEDGTIVPSHARFQWNDVANAVLVIPDADLDFDTDYTAEVGTGVTTMDGRNLPAPVSVTFHTRCAPDRLADCPPLPEEWAPPAGPPPRPDAGPRPRPDAGPDPIDAGTADAPSAGCGCHAAGAGGSRGAMLAIGAMLLGALRRARRRR